MFTTIGRNHRSRKGGGLDGVTLPVKDYSTIVEEILQDFANNIEGIDISDASDVAIKAKIYAARIVEITTLLQMVADNAFVQDASGIYLDNLVSEKGVKRKVATKATGILRFSRASPDTIDRPIPKGTIITTYPDVNGDTIDFQTTQDGVLLAGQLSVDILAEAIEAGTNGNVASGKITEPKGEYPAGIESVTNPNPFIGGTDEETDDELRARYFKVVQNPDNGGTPVDYENWALSIAGVKLAKTLPLNRGNGTVDILIASVDGEPSDELVSEVQALIDMKRPIGADARVIKAINRPIDVTASITVAEGYTFEGIRESLEQAITNYLISVPIGGIVRVTGIGNAIHDTEGVADYVMITPIENIQLSSNEIAVKGVYDLS